MISNRQLDINDQGLAENFESEQYKRYTWMEYELFLQPHILERCLSRLVKAQEIKGFEFYPISEERFNSYIKFSELYPNLYQKHIRDYHTIISAKHKNFLDNKKQTYISEERNI